MKTILLNFFCVIFLNPHLSSQDRFNEFKDYCTTHETILKQVQDSGMYGNIQVSERHLYTGETYVDVKAFQYDNGFLKRKVKLVHGKAVTPKIYIGSVNDNLQIIIITVYREDYESSKHEAILVDNIDKNVHLVALPGSYISKVIPFEDGMIVEQATGGIRSPVIDKFYSFIKLTDGKIVSEHHKREIRISD